MSRHQFCNKWTLRTVITLLVVSTVALIAWGDTFEAPWASSGHADAESEAFTHWDDDDPPEISTSCAKCHSTPGYLDFLGEDGTNAGAVDNPAPIGTTVTCEACHNEATIMMDSVVFPSGVEISGLGDSARCMQCHQGRESTTSVDQRIANADVVDDDTIDEDLSFRNIHYYAAGATLLGGEAMGGYQYAGKTYDVKFDHVEGLETCTDCHEPHSLHVRVELCGSCHEGVVDHEDLEHIRYLGSASDYDGDGGVAESIKDEIDGLRDILYAAIQNYAIGIGYPIVYDSHSYPYWFNAGDGSRYGTWTARLVRATFNYQFSLKDPGGFAHNAKYMIQLLYDSIEDLDPALVPGLHRDDAGHFAGSKEAFRHWDEDGHVSASCSKCHSATGLPFFLTEGVTASQPISNGLTCTTCHDAIPEFTRYAVDEVEFPSGAVVSFGEEDSANLCINCHQGRQSTVSVNEAIGGLDLDTVSGSLRFLNVHYYAAGATLFGSEVKGAYEYTGKAYDGRFDHRSNFDSCTECHDSHTLEVKTDVCAFCHDNGTDPHDYRKSVPDYDGDGDTHEGIAYEVETLHEALYAAIEDYAANVCGVPILYASNYPYIFIDTNGNGQVDAGENSYGNRYNAFTPRLLQAIYNYQYVKKDPGAFSHNGRYIIQILYDSLESLGTQVPVDMT
ncbi:MAG: hypothetical protein ACYTFW_02835, partial [Planctomycetota bacterium]